VADVGFEARAGEGDGAKVSVPGGLARGIMKDDESSGGLGRLVWVAACRGGKNFVAERESEWGKAAGGGDLSKRHFRPQFWIAQARKCGPERFRDVLVQV